jgi:ribosomal protein L40E
MKTCDWCGRQNADEAVYCYECGTQRFQTKEPAPKPAGKEALKGPPEPLPPDWNDQPALARPTSKICDWCGRQNSLDAVACYECGTQRFKGVEPVRAPAQKPRPSSFVQPARPHFNDSPCSKSPNYSEHLPSPDGFCRPHWKAIAKVIEQEVPPGERPGAWVALVRQWVHTLCEQLAPSYRVYETANFFILTSAPEQLADDACRSYEAAFISILRKLEGVASHQGQGKHAVLMFESHDDYYRYISYFHRDGEHPMSGGVCLKRGGYIHFAFPNPRFRSHRTVLVHELTHGCLAHLPLPSWINEALAMRMEQAVCDPAIYPLQLEELEQHLSFWNATSIQQFWSGESWDIPGEAFKLSYSLARILWRKIEVDLHAERGAILEFARTAQAKDAGEAAAKSCFGISLAALAEDFLGEGSWAPAPERWPKHSEAPASATLLS